ncbi:MAG TPA: hypothetical protein VGJ90_07550 [Methylophilaceae bacterium]|jgi:hypothetical protein
MIETIASAKLARKGINKGQVQSWSYAFLEECRTWFYVDCWDDSTLPPTKSVMVGTPQTLKSLAEQNLKGVRGVYVVTPPHINMTNEWKFQPLASISVVPNQINECQIFIYELQDGTRYADLRVEDLTELHSAELFLKIYE